MNAQGISSTPSPSCVMLLHTQLQWRLALLLLVQKHVDRSSNATKSKAASTLQHDQHALADHSLLVARGPARPAIRMQTCKIHASVGPVVPTPAWAPQCPAGTTMTLCVFQ